MSSANPASLPENLSGALLPTAKPRQRKPIMDVALPLVLVLATLSMVFLIAEGYTTTKPVQDMVSFWAAARLVNHDPYSVPRVHDLERSVGAALPAHDAYIARNPPWSLLFFLPLRPLSYRAAYGVWTVFSIVTLVVCARSLWRLYLPRESLIPAFLCLVYGPTLALLELGQSSILVLLGITIFLIAVNRDRDWIAGASLLLISIKPHIALLFLLAVALWILRNKRWKIVAGGAAALLASTAVVMAINPQVFQQYFHIAQTFARENGPYPNVGGMLFVITGQHWTAWFPEALGLAWVAGYWRSHRSSWDWKTDGSLVLLVSLLCSYYSYGYDEVILLPALVAAAATGNRRIFFPAIIVINFGYGLFLLGYTKEWGFTHMFLWWTGSAWLLAYVISNRQTKVQPAPPDLRQVRA